MKTNVYMYYEHSGSIPRNACRLQSIAMRDFKESVTTGQTDAIQSDPYVTLFFVKTQK